MAVDVNSLNKDLFRQLAGFALAPPTGRTSRPSDFQIAMQIMRNQPVDFSGSWSPALRGQMPPKKLKEQKPGVFGRIVDVLLRPLYASASAFKASGGMSSGVGMLYNLATGDVEDAPQRMGKGFEAGLKGLKGEEKTTYSQLIRENKDLPEWMRQGASGFTVGLAADILGDPLTFVPVGGGIKAAARAGYKIAGKESPYIFLPKATKRAIKRGRVGVPSEKPNIPIVPVSQVPQAFRALGPKGPIQHFQQALEDAPVVNTALEQGAREASIAEHILSPQQAALHVSNIAADGTRVLGAANVGPAAMRTYQSALPEFIYKSRGPVQNVIDRNSNKISLAITPQTRLKFRGPKGRFLPSSTKLPLFPKNTPEIPKTVKPKARVPLAPKNVFGPVNTALSNVLRESAGIPITKLRPGETIAERPAVHGIMSRFATWVGQKDLRPMVLDHMTSAVARASARVEAMEKAFKGFSEQEALEAWDIARNAKPRALASSETVSKLADNLTGQMEEFFRSRAVPETIAKGNSAALRAGVTMDDLNKALERYKLPFKFTNGKAVSPITHALTDYGHRTNWLISWETHAPKNLTELKRFIFGLQSATEQVLAEYAFLDDIAYRVGSRGKTAVKNVKVAHPRLVDYYFDKEIAEQLSTALKTMNEFYSPKSLATRFMRQAVSKWKTGVTIYHPRHHIANVIGDTFLMWMAGINNPNVFSKATKVMFANKGLYKDIASIDKLVGRNAVKDAMATPGTIVVKNKSGLGLTAQQVYVNAFNLGLLQKAGVVEDIAKEGIPLPGRLGKPFGGKVHGAFAKAAETREHYIKLAHFIGAIEKSRGKNVREIVENAAHEVRKWHPDGLDLTKTEQAIRALGIPFYSWMRKSTPLIIEGALMNPNKAFTSYSKVNYNLQQSLGITDVTPSDPYPDDQLFPAWLRDDNVPVLGKTGMGGIAGLIGGLGRQATDDEGKPIDGYTMLGPTNPVQDFFTQFGGFRNFGETKDAALSTINPMFRIPLELQQGRELYTGIPLKDRTTDYLTNQIPMVNQVARMTNVGPFGPTGRAEDYGYGNQEAFLNWLTGVNVTGTGPFIKSAEFELLPEQREENKRIREFSADIGYPLKDKGRIPQWIRDLYNQRQSAINGGN